MNEANEKPSKVRWLASCLLLLPLCGCATVLPHTADAIAPAGATLDDLWLGLGADVEMWVEQIGWLLAFFI